MPRVLSYTPLFTRIIHFMKSTSLTRCFPAIFLLGSITIGWIGQGFAQVNIPIETAHQVLVLQSDKNKDLHSIYLGKKLSAGADYAAIPAVYSQSEDYTGLLNSAYTPAGSR